MSAICLSLFLVENVIPAAAGGRLGCDVCCDSRQAQDPESKELWPIVTVGLAKPALIDALGAVRVQLHKGFWEISVIFVVSWEVERFFSAAELDEDSFVRWNVKADVWELMRVAECNSSLFFFPWMQCVLRVKLCLWPNNFSSTPFCSLPFN